MKVSTVILLSLLSSVISSAADDNDNHAAEPLVNDLTVVNDEELKVTEEASSTTTKNYNEQNSAEEDVENDFTETSSEVNKAQHEHLQSSEHKDDSSAEFAEKDSDSEEITSSEDHDHLNAKPNSEKPQNESFTNDTSSSNDREDDKLEEKDSAIDDDIEGNEQLPVHDNVETEGPEISKEQVPPSDKEAYAINEETQTISDVVENNATAESSLPGEDASESKKEEQHKPVMVDYANKSTGALILDKSANFQGTSNLLVADKDKYAMIPCSEEGVKYVIIGLSEDILVKSIKLSSYERYSSLTKRFEVLGSQTFPIMTEWEELGKFDAKPWFKENKEQTFELAQPSWARYLKFRFLDHYANEHYCSYTQIKVHGSTTLQGFHEMQLEARGEAEPESKPEEVDSATTTKEDLSDSEADTVQEQGVLENPVAINNVRQKDEDNGDDGVSDATEEDNITQMMDETGNDLVESSSKISNDDGITHESNDMQGSNEEESSYTDESINGSLVDEVTEQLESANPAASTEANQNERYIEVHENNSAEKSKSHEPRQHPQTENDGELVTSSEPDASERNSEPGNRTDDEQDNVALARELLETRDDTNEESTIPPVSSVTTAVNSALNSVKESAIMKDAVKGIHHMISAKSDDDEGIPFENNTAKDKVSEESQLERTDLAETSASTSTHEEMDEFMESDQPESLGDPTEIAITEAVLQNDLDGSIPEKLIPNENPKESVNSILNNDTAAREIKKESEVLLSKLSLHFPSASCLDSLDFIEFKKKIIEAGYVKGGNAGEKQKLPVPKNEPIFKKLTDEIKGLEASQNVHEQYIKAATNCYERVILDLGTVLASKEREQENRLLRLEEKIRYFTDKQERTRGRKVEEVRAVMQATFTSFLENVRQTFPVISNCYNYIYNKNLLIIQRLIASELIQKVINLAERYVHDLLVFFLGVTVCYMSIAATKMSGRKVQAPKEIKRKKRKSAKKKATSQSAPSLQTDEEDSF